jgi:glycosyltransferase involved in cell wall biosynthesis
MFAIGFTVFATVTSEFLPTGMLPSMAADLEVSTSQIGFLVSVWAATVVLTAIPQPQLPLLYSLPRLYLTIPSAGEGWGLTSTESASVGCPQIYTDFAALGELFDSHTGYPVEPMLMLTDPALNLERAYVNPEDVVCALCEVYNDPEIAEIKAIRARDYLSQFTWEFAANKFIKWLED